MGLSCCNRRQTRRVDIHQGATLEPPSGDEGCGFEGRLEQYLPFSLVNSGLELAVSEANPTPVCPNLAARPSELPIELGGAPSSQKARILEDDHQQGMATQKFPTIEGYVAYTKDTHKAKQRNMRDGQDRKEEQGEREKDDEIESKSRLPLRIDPGRSSCLRVDNRALTEESIGRKQTNEAKTTKQHGKHTIMRWL